MTYHQDAAGRGFQTWRCPGPHQRIPVKGEITQSESIRPRLSFNPPCTLVFDSARTRDARELIVRRRLPRRHPFAAPLFPHDTRWEVERFSSEVRTRFA